jgi:hypothetical protein
MASVVTGSFTNGGGATTSGVIDVRGSKIVDLTISGAFTGTAVLETSADGGTTYVTLYTVTATTGTFSAGAASSTHQLGAPCKLRLRTAAGVTAADLVYRLEAGNAY